MTNWLNYGPIYCGAGSEARHNRAGRGGAGCGPGWDVATLSEAAGLPASMRSVLRARIWHNIRGGLRATGYGLRAAGCGLRAAG